MRKEPISLPPFRELDLPKKTTSDDEVGSNSRERRHRGKLRAVGKEEVYIIKEKGKERSELSSIPSFELVLYAPSSDGDLVWDPV